MPGRRTPERRVIDESASIGVRHTFPVVAGHSAAIAKFVVFGCNGLAVIAIVQSKTPRRPIRRSDSIIRRPAVPADQFIVTLGLDRARYRKHIAVGTCDLKSWSQVVGSG